MTIIKLSEAKARFSEYSKLAEEGERIVVTKHTKPVCVIGPVTEADISGKKRDLGRLEGKVWMSPEFDAEDEGINNSFYGD